VWASDGDCDDGGPASHYQLCDYGTDCFDCGARTYIPPAPPPAPHPPPLSILCVENCYYSSDNDCDDGGAGSEYSICNLGNDCHDCGARYVDSRSSPPPPPFTFTTVCAESCYYSSDNDCDDGGAGSEYSICSIGNDCIDCGARQVVAPPPPAGVMALAHCSDTCNYASDNDCDDGGPGAEYSLCAHDTDCSDCAGPACITYDSAGTCTRWRSAIAPPAPPISQLCENTCRFSSDGDCDDGGPGQEFSLCGYGTDCQDCGAISLTPCNTIRYALEQTGRAAGATTIVRCHEAGLWAGGSARAQGRRLAEEGVDGPMSVSVEFLQDPLSTDGSLDALLRNQSAFNAAIAQQIAHLLLPFPGLETTAPEETLEEALAVTAEIIDELGEMDVSQQRSILASVSALSGQSAADVLAEALGHGGTPAGPATRVQTTVVAQGDVSDYTAAVQQSIAAKVAAELGIARSAVEVDVTSASVRITITVSFGTTSSASNAAASSASTTLSSLMTTPAAASAFLSTPALAVAVSSIEAPPVVVQAYVGGSGGGSVASDADGEVLTSGVVMAGVIVGVLLLCCASAYLLSKWMHASGGSTGRGSTASSLPSFARTSTFGRGSTSTKSLRLTAGEKAPRRHFFFSRASSQAHVSV